MKLLIQRVSQASVDVEGKIVGSISAGLLIFLGVGHDDGQEQLSWLVNKVVNLRIFEDDQGKMNRSLLDVKGEALVISQFTLYGDCSAGRRPSFTQSASPAHAESVYEKFIAELRKSGIKTETGIFGADMQVALINDGPVTFILER